jgi:YVTN family beta-propeller protein
VKPLLFAVIGCAALCTVLPAQYLETTIPVPQNPDVMRWNPANNRVYCAVGYPDAFGAVAVIDGASNTKLDSVMLRCQMPGGIAIDADRNRIFCAGSSYYPLEESLVTVIDGTNDSILAEITMGAAPKAICYNPVGNRLYCASQFADNIVIIDCSTYTTLATLSVPAGPCDMLYAPEVNKVYCADQGSRGSPNFMVTVIDGTTDSVVRTVFVGHYVRAICYNPVDRKVYSADAFDGTVTVIDATVDTVLARVQVNGSPFSLCWNPLLDRVYCADGDLGSLSMIDGVTDEIVGGVGLVSPAWQVLVDSAGGKLYCSNYLDNKVTVLDARTHGFLKTIDVGQAPRYMCQNPVDGRVYVGNSAGSSVSVIRDSASGGVDDVTPVPGTRRVAVTAWPNPSSGILNIRPAPGLNQERIGLYDVQGNAVARLQPGANDLRRLPTGTYLLRAAGVGETVKVILR